MILSKQKPSKTLLGSGNVTRCLGVYQGLCLNFGADMFMECFYLTDPYCILL